MIKEWKRLKNLFYTIGCFYWEGVVRDLTDYALLVLLGIFVINMVLIILGYKMKGKEAAALIGALATIGLWVGLGIVKIMDYDDGSSEIVSTVGLFSIIFSSMYAIYVFIDWLDMRKLQKLQQKQNDYQRELEKLEQEFVDRNHIYQLIQLLTCCGCDTTYFEKLKGLSDMGRITEEIKQKKAQLNVISLQINSFLKALRRRF